jgi:hypothetical protein
VCGKKSVRDVSLKEGKAVSVENTSGIIFVLLNYCKAH